MKQIRHVFCDLDGTLLKFDGWKQSIIPKTKQIVKKLVDNGIGFTIATGRKLADILGVYKELKIDKQVNYAIASNGSILYDTQNNKFLISSCLKQNDLLLCNQIIDELKAIKLEFVCAFYTLKNDILIYQVNANDKQAFYEYFLKFEGGFAANKLSFIDDPNNHYDITKAILFFDNKNFAKWQKVYQKYRLSGSNLLITSLHSFEVNAITSDKGAAIKQLVTRLNLKNEQIMCLGDSYNDLGMFDYGIVRATLSVAPMELKNKATNIYQIGPSDFVYEALSEQFGDLN